MVGVRAEADQPDDGFVELLLPLDAVHDFAAPLACPVEQASGLAALSLHGLEWVDGRIHGERARGPVADHDAVVVVHHVVDG